MARVLLVTNDTSNIAYTRTAAAITALGHTVVGSLDTTAALNAAWATPSDIIANVRTSAAGGAYQTWIRDKWVAGVPLLVGGLELGAANGATTHLAETVGILSDARTYDSIQQQATAATGMRVKSHPITAGYNAGFLYAMQSAQNWVVLDAVADASFGTEVGDVFDSTNSTDSGVVMSAVEKGDTLRSVAAGSALSPGTAPARAVFCGWLYAGQSDYLADAKTILGQAITWLRQSPGGNLHATLPTMRGALAGTRTVPTTGTLATGLRPLSASLAGTSAPPGVSGSPALTLPRMGAALAGTSTPPPRAGTMAAALPRFTTALAGFAPPATSATVAAKLPAMGLVVAGHVTGHFNELAATLPAFTADLVGQVPIVTGTDTSYRNDGYTYGGTAEVDYAPPVAPPPPGLHRQDVRRVHQSLPTPTLVRGRPQ